MEIKIQCDCGQKYKFDVEPVNGQMPFAVQCPLCRVDGTARANVLLQQLVPPAPVIVPVAPAPIAPAPMRPAALRINQPHSPAAMSAAAVAEAEAGDETDEGESGSIKELKLGWKVWGLIALFILMGLVGSFDKWSRRVSFVKDMIGWVKVLTGSGSETEVATQAWPHVLPDDDGTLVLIKSGDHKAVAQACAQYYAEKMQQKLVESVSSTVDAAGENALYLVMPAHDGYVELQGSGFWDEQQERTLAGLAEFVSKQMGTITVCALMGDDAESGVVGIYENGATKFHCKRVVSIRGGELVEAVEVQGKAWAEGLGFKPEEGNWKKLTMYDVDRLAQAAGFKAGEAKPESWIVLSKPLGKS